MIEVEQKQLDSLETQEDDEAGPPWSEWLAELQVLLGHVIANVDGWNACYGAGLSPAEAIACRDHREKRVEVEDYWSTSVGRYKLRFG